MRRRYSTRNRQKIKLPPDVQIINRTMRTRWKIVRARVAYFFAKLLSKIFKPKLVKNPVFRYPRNLVCFCGSRRKFKHCHEQSMPKWVLRVEAKRLQKTMNEIVKDIGHDPFMKDNGFL